MRVDPRLTYEDYRLLPNDGKRYEIIDGELFVTRSPLTVHQRIVTQLSHYLSTFLEETPVGEVFVSPFDVVFSRYDVVEPDLLFVSKKRASVVTRKNVQGAPDLVVEVLSETTAKTDRRTKLRLYARYRVKEYWIIDPKGPSAQVYRRSKGAFALAPKPRAADDLTSPLFPGVSLPLRQLVE